MILGQAGEKDQSGHKETENAQLEKNKSISSVNFNLEPRLVLKENRKNGAQGGAPSVRGPTQLCLQRAKRKALCTKGKQQPIKVYANVM